jgi:predicted PurR-regulated permease PerM
VEFVGQVNTVLAGYMRAQILSCLVMGLVTSLGFAVLGVPYALVVGMAAGLLEFVPLIGPLATAFLVVGMVRGARLLAVLAFLLAVRVLQDTTIYPRLMGRRIHLPAPAVLVAVWTGASVGGILGVLLAVPLVGVGAVAARHWRDYRAIERLVREHALRQGLDEAAGLSGETRPGPGERDPAPPATGRPPVVPS